MGDTSGVGDGDIEAEFDDSAMRIAPLIRVGSKYTQEERTTWNERAQVDRQTESRG